MWRDIEDNVLETVLVVVIKKKIKLLLFTKNLVNHTIKMLWDRALTIIFVSI